MPDIFGPFDGTPWAQAPWYRDAFARAGTGVYGTPAAAVAAGDLALTLNGLSWSMGLGRAHIRGAGYERTETPAGGSVPANTNTTLDRRDRLVLRRDLAAKTVTPLLLQGVPAASPLAPAPTQVDNGVWDLPLFSWTTPKNSGTVLTGVVDERLWITPDGVGPVSAPAPLDFVNANFAQWNSGGFNELIRAHRSPDSWVEVTGTILIVAAQAAGSYVLAQLRPGWRPPTNLVRFALYNGTTFFPVDVRADSGNLVGQMPAAAAGTYVQLLGIRWKA